MKMDARLLRGGMKFWPPFLGAGISVKNLSEDFRDAVVELKLGRFNRNMSARTSAAACTR